MIRGELDHKRGGHYSPAVRAGDFLFVAGQTPRNAQREIVGTTIEAQTDATLRNLADVLGAAGAAMHQVVKVTVHLADLSLQPAFNAAYARHFPTFLPARTTVGSALNGILVEIDAIAWIGTSGESA